MTTTIELSPLQVFLRAAAAHHMTWTALFRKYAPQYREGEDAAEKGFGLTACPYAAETLDRAAWTMGFKAELDRNS